MRQVRSTRDVRKLMCAACEDEEKQGESRKGFDKNIGYLFIIAVILDH